jgi:hypothetical protein
MISTTGGSDHISVDVLDTTFFVSARTGEKIKQKNVLNDFCGNKDAVGQTCMSLPG